MKLQLNLLSSSSTSLKENSKSKSAAFKFVSTKDSKSSSLMPLSLLSNFSSSYSSTPSYLTPTRVMLSSRRLDMIVVLLLLLFTAVFMPAISTAAPTQSDDSLYCESTLVPRELVSSRRSSATPIVIKCETTIKSHSYFPTVQPKFANPVIDLSFGGAPRTGVFFIRGNVTCDDDDPTGESIGGERIKCWSVFPVSTFSLNHLIINEGEIKFSCQVADSIRLTNGSHAVVRCDDKGKLSYSKVLDYDDSCDPNDVRKECPEGSVCGTKDGGESAWRTCLCPDGLVPVKGKSLFAKTQCMQEVSLHSSCNHSEQCISYDAHSQCIADNELERTNKKTCECIDGYIASSVTESRVAKPKCRLIAPTTSSSSTSTASLSSSSAKAKNEINEEEDGEDYGEEDYGDGSNKTRENTKDKLMEGTTPNGEGGSLSRKSKSRKEAGSSNVGLIIFLVAILLAIIIVAIIIRVRKSSDSRVITSKKRNSPADDTNKTDGSAAAAKPILSQTDNGIDETDRNNTASTTPAAQQGNNNSNVRQTHV